jgi:hypothetical protein
MNQEPAEETGPTSGSVGIFAVYAGRLSRVQSSAKIAAQVEIRGPKCRFEATLWMFFQWLTTRKSVYIERS